MMRATGPATRESPPAATVPLRTEPEPMARAMAAEVEATAAAEAMPMTKPGAAMAATAQLSAWIGSM
jgi:hypothetical protein